MIQTNKIKILSAEDDEEYYLLLQQAFEGVLSSSQMDRVGDGEELIDYLLKKGKYVDVVSPDLVLLDLNMPRKDGREALAEIKGYESLKHIPIVILTTSKSRDDILETYRLGANSYILKPYGFKQLTEMVTIFQKYWFQTVEIPNQKIMEDKI